MMNALIFYLYIIILSFKKWGYLPLFWVDQCLGFEEPFLFSLVAMIFNKKGKSKVFIYLLNNLCGVCVWREQDSEGKQWQTALCPNPSLCDSSELCARWSTLPAFCNNLPHSSFSGIQPQYPISVLSVGVPTEQMQRFQIWEKLALTKMFSV